MNRRLPMRAGEWIDRSQPVEFRFEGETFRGFAGDVLASALWANHVQLQGRSFKYHRPRGIYSLANHDANILVEDGQRTNLRGDALPITPELDVRAVNTLGGLARDRLRITERFHHFLPVGFYYKAFYTPRRLFRLYENQMRKVAGLGKINPANRQQYTPKNYDFCDLLVVGGGPAGLSGAVAAAQQGLDVLLVDEHPRLGGSLAWQWSSEPAAAESLPALLDQVEALPKLRHRLSTLAAGCYADRWLALVDSTRLTKLRAGAVLIASGCFEQPAVFQQNDLPGVMLGSAAQRLIRLYSVRPCDRAVVLAANSDGYRVALDLHSAQVAVVAVVDLREEGEPSELAARVAELGIPIHVHSTIFEALPGKDRMSVRGAVVAPLNASSDTGARPQTRLECDGIMVSVGWAPNAGLAYQAGAKFHYSSRLEQFVPSALPSGVFVAGRANGTYGLAAQLIDGRRAALAAAAFLGQYEGPIPTTPEHTGPAPSHPYPVCSHAGKKNFVDLDEDLHLADFANAYQEGYDNIELVKRYTTVGMGPSQGKLSNMNAVRILARLKGATIDQTGSTTSRPFQQPVPLEHLAGRCFHPQRRTPIHDWHLQAQAEMVHAGAWLRPEYYRAQDRSREECIFEEAVNVRRGVGLIDVGTLGKLQVNGPDAVRFLERIYTGRFAKQKTGSLRYGLACDELGIVIEDGVIARLAEDRFYVTATSSGAAAFYRELQRWALLWEMDVVLSNVTGQLAAMNVAGPKSREVLSTLTDIELGPEPFPYLASREGRVAGVPAVVMRVGFVGELGFEVHVPAAYGRHVWTALIDAGLPHRIHPFGVEAQRLLRLEKGHLIVSQDTDALTNPFEADLAWAIGKNKPFFVGARSLQIVRNQPLTRRLVGLAFADDSPGRLPDECHLIIDKAQIAGRITSIAHRSTLGFPIALAMLRPDLCEVGTAVEVRIEDGSLVPAKVVALPFYDPGNCRQH